MGVERIIFGGVRSDPIISVLSMPLSLSLYVIYSNVPYSSTNVLSKLLLPSYDFIVVGGGSVGMSFHIVHTNFGLKCDKNVIKINVPVYLRMRKSILFFVRSTDTRI